MLEIKDLRTEALRLPEHERAALAATLLESLPMTAFAEEALLETARARNNDIATGECAPVSWEVFATMLKELEQE
jgi:hypothetical protein